MKKLALVLVGVCLLAGAPASAKPKPKGKPPVISYEGSSPIGYRRLPDPLPTNYVFVCWDETKRNPHNAINYRIYDPDNKSVDTRFYVTDSSNRTVYTVPWGSFVSLTPSKGQLICQMWTPDQSYSPGLYRIHVQAKDARGNKSGWIHSDPIPFF